MADTHNQFLEFERAISVTTPRKNRMSAARKALEKKIIEYFKTHEKLYVPKFYIQGSYKMGTMVLSKDNTYDVDLGVYFLTKPTITSLSLQNNIVRAIEKHTSSGVQHREKCVRVIYKDDFDIDLPVYYKTENDLHPYLATKTGGWFKSDPKEICDWFNAKKDKNGQLMRLVKYFKAWANCRAKKMPNGIAFTVWAAQNYKPDNRDDRAFFETAKAIEKCFGGGLVDTEVINPTTPGDNLLKLDFNQRSHFKSVFRQMLIEVEYALQSNSMKKACNIWRQELGEKFPTIN